jgi:hypothetical protein
MRHFYVFISLFFIFSSGCSLFKPKPEEPTKISIRDIIKEEGYKIAVYFEINSDELNLISKDSIIRTAKFLAVSDTKAYLTGFADKTGNKDNNVILSEKRVNAAKEFLISLGIDAENVYIDYFGDELPVEFGDTSEALAKNRRVEILLTSKIEDAVAQNAQTSKASTTALDMLKLRKAAPQTDVPETAFSGGVIDDDVLHGGGGVFLEEAVQLQTASDAPQYKVNPENIENSFQE